MNNLTFDRYICFGAIEHNAEPMNISAICVSYFSSGSKVWSGEFESRYDDIYDRKVNHAKNHRMKTSH